MMIQDANDELEALPPEMKISRQVLGLRIDICQVAATITCAELGGSSHRLLKHFRVFDRDGDEHAGGTGGFALLLFPTAQGAEADS